VVKKLILGAVPALMMMSAPAYAEAPTWKVSEVSGRVQLTENGQSRAATRGALLSSGSTIVTAPASRAVIVRGQEFVVISPGTRIRVPEASSSNKIMQLIQDFGSALFKIEKKSTPHFGVQTPYLAAVVKGTTFTVTVGPDGSKVRVTEGAVEVSTLDGGASDLVTPGTVALVGKSDRYTLTVEGKETKILRSDKAPALGAATAKGAPNPASLLKGDNRSERAATVRITKAVHEKPVSLEEATGGVLKGNSASDHAQAEFNDHSKRVIKEIKDKENKPGAPAEPGKPDDAGKPPVDSGKPDDAGKPPVDSGKPDDAGKPPADSGKPDDAGKPPVDSGKPDDAGKPPVDSGKPDDAGKPPADSGKPDDAGKPPVDSGKPDQDEGGKPGKDDGGKPDKDDGGKPGKDDGDKPAKEEDGKDKLGLEDVGGDTHGK
jgi:hypothetical protein